MTEKEILALEDRRIQCMIRGDFAGLEALVHDQLIYTDEVGRVKYKSASISEQKVRIFGDAALVTGSAEMQAEVGGQPKTPA